MPKKIVKTLSRGISPRQGARLLGSPSPDVMAARAMYWRVVAETRGERHLKVVR